MPYKDPLQNRKYQRDWARRHKRTPAQRLAANAAKRRWRQTHKAKAQAQHDAWRAAHPEQVREQERRCRARRKAGGVAAVWVPMGRVMAKPTSVRPRLAWSEELGCMVLDGVRPQAKIPYWIPRWSE